MTARTFTAVTAITPAEAAASAPRHFDALIDPLWTIGGKPNGGYLLALLGRAAVAAGPHPDVIAASAIYLRSPDPGSVTIEAEVLRAGRSASQVRARLVQDDRACVEALLTTSQLDPDAEVYWDGGVPDPNGPGEGGSIRVPGTNPAGIPVPIMDQVELDLDRQTSGFAVGRPSGHGELRGTLALPAGESFDAVSLLYAVDALPPATFDIELTGWVPTLELTVYVRAAPAPGPVRVLQRAHLIDAQRVDEVCWVWDSRGRVVAQASQLAGIRLG